jgi:dephospho-CoA kinase
VLGVRFTLGLTGGIGAGKSTVARLLQSAGSDLVDTDAIARRLAEPGGSAIEALREAFGPSALDGRGGLDRAWMRERAFAQASVRRRLEDILHPMIGARVAEATSVSTAPLLVLDVPLLTESVHWRRRVDRVVVVDCEEATQIERVVRRSGWSEDQVRAVISRQAGRAARRAVADAVIFNQGLSLDALQADVLGVLASWGLAPAATPGRDLS